MPTPINQTAKATSLQSIHNADPNPLKPTNDDDHHINLNLETIWPYAKDQSLKLNAILDRLRGSKNLIENVIDFFKTIAHIEEDAGKDYKKSLRHFKGLSGIAGDSSEPPFIDDTQHAPGLNGIFASVYAIGNHHVAISQHIREFTIKGLESIYNIHHRKIKDIKSNIHKQSTWITKSRQDTLQTIATHEKTQSTQSRRGSVPTNMKDQLHDPWLTEIAIHMALKDNIEKENAYQASTLALIQQAKQAESESITSILHIIHDHLDSRTAKQTNLQDSFTGLIAIIHKFDTGRPMTTYCDTLALVQTPCWQTARSFSSFPYRVELKNLYSSISFQGLLFRRGTIRKSKWKPSWFVLTESGYIHCFDDSSSPFCGADISVPQDLEHACSKLPVILFSVCLRSRRTSVAHLPDTKANQDHQFEIVSGSNHHHSSLLPTLVKKDIRYLFKAESEESMVDWVCAIRRVISLYAPAPPPAEPIEDLPVPLPESPPPLSASDHSLPSSSPISLSTSNTSTVNDQRAPPAIKPAPVATDEHVLATPVPKNLPPSPAPVATDEYVLATPVPKNLPPSPAPVATDEYVLATPVPKNLPPSPASLERASSTCLPKDLPPSPAALAITNVTANLSDMTHPVNITRSSSHAKDGEDSSGLDTSLGGPLENKANPPPNSDHGTTNGQQI